MRRHMCVQRIFGRVLLKNAKQLRIISFALQHVQQSNGQLSSRSSSGTLSIRSDGYGKLWFSHFSPFTQFTAYLQTKRKCSEQHLIKPKNSSPTFQWNVSLGTAIANHHLRRIHHHCIEPCTLRYSVCCFSLLDVNGVAQYLRNYGSTAVVHGCMLMFICVQYDMILCILILLCEEYSLNRSDQNWQTCIRIAVNIAYLGFCVFEKMRPFRGGNDFNWLCRRLIP